MVIYWVELFFKKPVCYNGYDGKSEIGNSVVYIAGAVNDGEVL